MADILEYLNKIKNAVYGKDVRQAIVDGISQCYTDGKAGVNDLEARQLIEAVAAVNEGQTAALEVLQAKIEELEESEGGTQQSTTIDIPTVLVDGGVVENVSVNNNGTTTRHITFTTEFTETPKVMVAIGKNAGAVSQYGYLSANILYPTVSKTGFDFFLANRTGSDRSPGVVWYAYQPTVKTIDLDITIPDAQGMTEAQVREITSPISAAVEAIKTGYDGTVYQTAAEAIRTQINDLHVLIGDEPGTAIQSSAIGYGEDSNVEDALDGLNGRLDQLDGGGMTEEAKQALLTLVSHIGLWDDNHGQDYIDALEAALYPPASLTRITAVYTQSGVVYEGSDINNLKADLVVTAVYSDSTTEVITAYTLTGTLEEGTSTITVSFGGKTTTFNVTVTGQLLPSGYQQLEYVYSDGGVYFESLVKPTAYPIRIETGIYKASQANAEQAIICKKIGTSSSLEVGYNATANTLFAYSGASAKITDPAMYGNVLDIVVEFNSASPYKTLDVTADEETLTAESDTANNASILADSPLHFFGQGTTRLNYLGRMYYCKVYSGGELIGDFIPCYDKETGHAGLYETVGGTFHYSQGPKGFKRGGEV